MLSHGGSALEFDVTYGTLVVVVDEFVFEQRRPVVEQEPHTCRNNKTTVSRG